jgi:hypothetical protein
MSRQRIEHWEPQHRSLSGGARSAVVLLGIFGTGAAFVVAGAVWGAFGNAIPLAILIAALIVAFVLTLIRASRERRATTGGTSDGSVWLGGGIWYGGDSGVDCSSGDGGGGGCGGGE